MTDHTSTTIDTVGHPDCSPVGSLAAPVLSGPSRCHCGAQVWPVPRGGDWAWADESGHTGISNADAVDTEWRKIRDEMWDITYGPDAKRTKTAEEATAETPAVNRYSVMAAQLALGWVDMGHVHDPVGGVGAAVAPPPWCCGEPMQAMPGGWRCRVVNTLVPYDDMLGETWVLRWPGAETGG